jgi:protein disulfide isomerase family A protein 3
MTSKFEEQIESYSKDKFTVGLVRSWVKETLNGLCPVVESPPDAAEVGYPQAICIYNVDYVRDPKGTQYWRNRIMKVAGGFSDMKFAVGPVQSWAGALHEVGKSGGDGKKPICLVFEDQRTKYLMDEDFSMDSFEAFLKSYKAGDLEPHMKSETGIDNTGKANLDLTAKNWKEHVDGKSDLFVKFYALWCGHCKTLAPKWEEMATKFADDDTVTIAHFNADANDVPSGFEVQGFPTMFWVPAGGKPQKYQEGRETKDMVKFVKKNKTGGKKDEL